MVKFAVKLRMILVGVIPETWGSCAKRCGNVDCKSSWPKILIKMGEIGFKRASLGYNGVWKCRRKLRVVGVGCGGWLVEGTGRVCGEDCGASAVVVVLVVVVAVSFSFSLLLASLSLIEPKLLELLITRDQM